MQGLTLVELIVTVALIAIVASVAVPAFNDMVLRHRASATTNEFLAALGEARAEASRRRRTVVLCARPTGGDTAVCNAANQGSGACGCDGGAWENGWLAYVDVNADGALDTNGDVLINAQPPLANNASLRRSGDNDANGTLAFNARGNLVGTPATFALCLADDVGDSADDEEVLTRARFVEVALSGRAGVRGALASESTTAAACRFGQAG